MIPGASGGRILNTMTRNRLHPTVASGMKLANKDRHSPALTVQKEYPWTCRSGCRGWLCSDWRAWASCFALCSPATACERKPHDVVDGARHPVPLCLSPGGTAAPRLVLAPEGSSHVATPPDHRRHG